MKIAGVDGTGRPPVPIAVAFVAQQTAISEGVIA